MRVNKAAQSSAKGKLKRWWELDYEQAMEQGHEQYKTEEKELKRTTMMMPITMRIEVELLKGRWNYSQKYLSFQLVHHGHAILQHKHKTAIAELRALKSRMGHPRIGRVKNWLYTMRTTVNGLKDPSQRAIFMPKYMVESLSDIASTLSTEQSSLIRLCMYYSFVTCNGLSHEILTVAHEEISKFEQYLLETNAIFYGFEVAEQRYNELSHNENKTLKKEGT